MGTIAVIDYGMGNLHSVAKALQKVAPSKLITITSNKKQIKNAERIVLPGVGAIGDCKNALVERGLKKVILENSKDKPTLAICVGMQLLLEHSEENNGTKALGILNGRVTKIPHSKTIKVPHIGWNKVKQTVNHNMWKNIPDNSFFYFVHSYCCLNSTHAAAETEHGINFISAFASNNIFAVQFHPEKSQKVGLQIYKNFIKWNGVDW